MLCLSISLFLRPLFQRWLLSEAADFQISFLKSLIWFCSTKIDFDIYFFVITRCSATTSVKTLITLLHSSKLFIWRSPITLFNLDMVFLSFFLSTNLRLIAFWIWLGLISSNKERISISWSSHFFHSFLKAHHFLLLMNIILHI